MEDTFRRSVLTRPATEETFTTSDGIELFYRAWAPVEQAAEPDNLVSDAPVGQHETKTNSRHAIVLFHRGHEHSARWQYVIDKLQMPDCWCFAWDARGHGRSPGDRGYAESFGRMVQDADEFVHHLATKYEIPISQMAVLAQSVGAVLAITWVHDFAPPIRALVIATPAFRVKLYVPGAIPGLRLLRKLRPKAFIRSYVKPRMLTHDVEQARAYARDELISPQIAVNILLDLYDTSTRIIADAGAIITPTLLLISGKDWVVELKPQERLFERLSSPIRDRAFYAGFYHSTYWEKQRELPIERSRQFLQSAFDQKPQVPSLLNADEQGYTKYIFDKLHQPLPWLSLRRFNFLTQRLTMQTIGRLSKGIRVGWQTGFDSGESLDHVYINKAEGTTWLGRFVDRIYLDSPGWRGIRQRKVHILAMLERAIAYHAERNSPIRIMDIAAGPGRYVLEALQRHEDKDISALLCDRDPGGLSAGKRLANELEIKNVEYLQHDAFDEDQLAHTSPQPNIAIISGLFELFPSNEPIRSALAGLSQAVPTGGLLIYTNQPWHPQQEMIARVLPNREGEPWVMRCRTQAEMDQLVAAAGFEKIQMLIDDEGIFSVSLAVKQQVNG